MIWTPVPTFQATIAVGLRVGYTDEVMDPVVAERVIQQYVNEIGLCVSVTSTKFIYTNGSEPGLLIGLINYPRFPSSGAEVKLNALRLAELLKCTLKQQRVTVITTTETIMVSE